MTDAKPESAQSEKTTFERTPDFISTYANSVVYEATAWDLKMKFGQVENVAGNSLVKQHITVTIPWAQAKLALYWLRLQVQAMELQTGKIPIRKDVIPVAPPELPPEQANDPATKAIYEMVVKLHQDFIASL